MADDMGWGDTGYNGHPYLKTPNLDAMSREGITFTRFYSAAAMCSPTRGSCYTGRNPLIESSPRLALTHAPVELTRFGGHLATGDLSGRQGSLFVLDG